MVARASGLLVVASLAGALAACRHGDAPAGTTTDRPVVASASPLPSLALSALSAPPAPVEPGPPMPRPRRGRLDEAFVLEAGCESCHAAEAAEWRASRHHTASTNTAYAASLAREPLAFCRGCHAPEGEPKSEDQGPAGKLGVGCVTCHVTEEGSVLAGPARGRSKEPAPHGVHRSADFAGPKACAACHEFRFPSGFGDDDSAFMQTTIREHARSPLPQASCASCHMPVDASASRRRSHAFAEVRDPAWLASRLEVKAERLDEHQVRITLRQTSAAHAYPTGDLFRRLVVGVEGKKTKERVVRPLGRRYREGPMGAGRRAVGDDRVLGEPVSVDMELDDPGPYRWWVTLERIAFLGEHGKAEVESEVRLHSGEVP